MSSLSARPGTLIIAAVVLLACQVARNGAIVGVIKDRDGVPMPGVFVTALRVTSESGGGQTSYHDITDAEGRYEFSGLTGGTYELEAKLAEFCLEKRSSLHVTGRARVVVDLTMKLVPLHYYRVTSDSLPMAVEQADAVVHLRITKTQPSQLPDRAVTCSIVLTEHEAQVLAEVKTDPAHWPDSRRLRFVQHGAGDWTDGVSSVRGGETPFVIGEEYVAFLKWNAELEVFEPMSGSYWMIPVRDRRIAPRGRRWRGSPDGTPVDSFLDEIRASMR